MVQDQLVDYISSQMKLGVSREAISSALVSAGWVAADVEDTMKKALAGPSQSTGSSQAGASVSARPSQTATAGTSMSSSQAATVGEAKPVAGAGPRMIRVSDLVSASGAMAAGSSQVSSSVSSRPMGSASPSASSGGALSSSPQAKKNDPTTTADAGKFGGKITGNNFEAAGAMPHNGGGMPVMKIVGGILILGLAGLAWYFYSQNGGLAAKVASLNSASEQVKGQFSALQSQLDASNNNLGAQIKALKAANDDLTLNLSFYVTPAGGATSTPVVIGGTLGGAGSSYVLTTPRGAKILVVSSGGVKASTLKPLVGGVVQLAGTYVPGSGQMTVTSIISPSPVVSPAPPVAPSPTPSATSTAATSTKQ